ncbi:allergen Tha p 1 [Galleria mellonella]|uniref:Allergen Tha p 1-like n=1 Tax=Galleria mellonella TaxID=7137 RepID=A0A5C0E4B7_GALME|nr:allergen Tha p 1 [Galleria mellonella]QEI46810.1 chemosensory protein 12 [Galleria mellonella]
MKLLLVLSVVVVASVYAKPGSTYTDKWDHINVDEILESQRLLRGYVDCLLDKGRCTPDGKALKETIPDALEFDCSKCTAKQKTSSDKVIRFLVNKRPELWKELKVRYDPDSIYEQRYKDKLNALSE